MSGVDKENRVSPPANRKIPLRRREDLRTFPSPEYPLPSKENLVSLDKFRVVIRGFQRQFFEPFERQVRRFCVRQKLNSFLLPNLADLMVNTKHQPPQRSRKQQPSVDRRTLKNRQFRFHRIVQAAQNSKNQRRVVRRTCLRHQDKIRRNHPSSSGWFSVRRLVFLPPLIRHQNSESAREAAVNSFVLLELFFDRQPLIFALQLRFPKIRFRASERLQLRLPIPFLKVPFLLKLRLLRDDEFLCNSKPRFVLIPTAEHRDRRLPSRI